MRRSVQLKIAALLTVLAMLALTPAGPLLAAAQQTADVQVNDSLSTTGGTVTGTVWRSDDTPLPNASLQLRDVSTGQIVGSTRANQLGRFSFARVSPGRYIVELIDENRNVLALGETLTIGPNQTVATFIRLTTSTRWYGGFLSTVAAAAVAAAAAIGVTALGNGGQPASARF
jgi:hypothetical protein